MSVWTAPAAILNRYLTDTAIRQRATTASDDALGEQLTWEDSDPIPCLLDRTTYSPSEAVSGSALGTTERFQAVFPLGTDLLPPDRVIINGLPYEVTETNVGQTTAALFAVDLVRVR